MDPMDSTYCVLFANRTLIALTVAFPVYFTSIELHKITSLSSFIYCDFFVFAIIVDEFYFNYR